MEEVWAEEEEAEAATQTLNIKGQHRGMDKPDPEVIDIPRAAVNKISHADPVLTVNEWVIIYETALIR